MILASEGEGQSKVNRAEAEKKVRSTASNDDGSTCWSSDTTVGEHEYDTVTSVADGFVRYLVVSRSASSSSRRRRKLTSSIAPKVGGLEHPHSVLCARLCRIHNSAYGRGFET
jgi:hypothetical protein